MRTLALGKRLHREGKEDAVPIDAETTENLGADTKSGPTTAKAPGEDQQTNAGANHGCSRRSDGRWRRLLAYGLLPAATLIVATAAGYLKWCDTSARETRLAAVESVHAATDGTVAMLSYRPDTVERDLGGARERLTGPLKDSYTSLTHDVVIPGSKQKQISAVATVPAASWVSASPSHAVALLFVDQTVTVGNDPPSDTASRVRVTLDKVGGRWLIAAFDPI